MGYFAGLDISDATTNICIIDTKGVIVYETTTSTDPQAIISVLDKLSLVIEKVGMETGAKSNWLYRAISLRYQTTCYDAFKMAKLISVNINKTDRNDARIIAEATRLTCLSNIVELEVYVKKESSQEVITLIRCREALVQQNINTYNRIRAVLKTHGFSLPHIPEESFIQVITSMLKTLPQMIAKAVKALLSSYAPTLQAIENLTKDIVILANTTPNAQLLMTIPEVGPITGLYLATLIDDPKRFSDAGSMGSYLGLTPLQYSSGEQKLLGSISKRGDALARKLLVGVARRILQNNKKSCALKRWGQKVEKRRGKGRAAIALARYVSVLMLAMLMNQTVYKEPPITKTHKNVCVLTSEELKALLKLSQKKGSIELRSMQSLKKMATNV